MQKIPELKIELFSKQLQAYKFLQDNITNEVLYGGGSRGGKSYLGCAWQILRRITMPESFGLIAREELTKLKDTTLLTFFKVLKEYDLQKYCTYNAQSFTADFITGSKIFFREIKYLPSDMEFDRLGSYDLTDCFLDEAQQISAKAISVLKGRFSILKTDKWETIPKALYTCNPKRNWIYNDFVRPASMGVLNKDKQFIKALPPDNPYTERSYIDNLTDI
jgi:phage terminase large subunit